MGPLQRLPQAQSQPLPRTVAQVGQAGTGADTAGLERSWQELDQQLRALDGLIPAEPGVKVIDPRALPPVPQLLLDANAPASVQLNSAKVGSAAPLGLPGPSSLQAGPVQSLTLEQALAIAFANSATLQAQREKVAATTAQLRASQGLYWPTLSAVVSGSSGQSSTSLYAPVGNTGLGFGPNFAMPSGAFAVPTGGGAYLNTYSTSAGAGLQLNYALLDFARNPVVQAARAQLGAARTRYAAQLRSLQLQVSESYFQLQQADQTVRINQATLANDLVILAESLDLQRAGLVPRLNGLRRNAISASDQQTLIQSLADRAVARRQLAVLLNLPPQITPAARDPIRPLARWPLNLEQSLLAAYRGNPELETILATREALLRQRDATAAGLLPKLSLFAGGGLSGSSTSTFDISTSGGGCCGATVIPMLNQSGYDWSVGLTLQWLLFDGGSTANQAEALARQAAASSQTYAAERNAIRLRLETAFFNHEASLAKLAAARLGVTASLEAFRDVKLRYKSGLSSEVDLSDTQRQLVTSLLQRLNATVGVNVTYARLLRELLPMPRDPSLPVQPRLSLDGSTAF
jgi:outer membrane protein TolC